MPSEVGTFSQNTTAVGGGDFDWTNPGNAYVDDDSDATCVNATPPPRISYELHLFDMGLSAIADTDVVDGVQFDLRYHGVGAGVNEDTVWVRLADASKSTDSEHTAALWPDTEGDRQNGDATSLWGEVGLTGLDVKNTNFGFVIRASMRGFGTAHIDSVIPTITYTLGVSSEIALTGNTLAITDGDVTPRLPDGTDFNNAVASYDTYDQDFVISNSGDGELTLTGTPKVVIGGADANQFSVTAQPSSPVAVSGSTTFTVRFTPTSVGVKNATLSIDNNDADEDPYNFSIQGTGVVSLGNMVPFLRIGRMGR